jgi:hypothetical protein
MIMNLNDLLDEFICLFVFFSDTVLKMSPGIDQPGTMKWDLTLCSLLGWILVLAVLSKGIKSLGKVSPCQNQGQSLNYLFISLIKKIKHTSEELSLIVYSTKLTRSRLKQLLEKKKERKKNRMNQLKTI